MKITRRNFMKALGAAAVVAGAAISAPSAYAEDVSYSYGDTVTVSGTVYFEEEPYQELSLGLPVYTYGHINDGTQIWHLLLKTGLYPYYKAAFAGVSVTIECEYRGTSPDGIKLLLPKNLVEGETKTDLVKYLQKLYCGNTENPDFGILPYCYDYGTEFITVSEDGLSMTVDTNPYNMGLTTLGKVASLADAYVGSEMIQDINSVMGMLSYVWLEMSKTRAIDGTQKETVGNIRLSWTYYSQKGLEVLYMKMV